MKKLLSLILALTLIAGMGMVSFAAGDIPGQKWNGTTPPITLVGPFVADEDEDWFYSTVSLIGIDNADYVSMGMTNYLIEYGDTVYYAIVDGDYPASIPNAKMFAEGSYEYDHVTDSDIVEKLKLKYFAEMGGDLIEKVEIVKKNIRGVNYIDYAARGLDEYYGYFIAIKIVDKQVNYDSDVGVSFEMNRKADTSKGIEKIKDLVFDDSDEQIAVLNLDFNVFYDDTWISNSVAWTVDDSVVLDWGEHYALKFDSDEEVEFEFGTDPNEGAFTVDASGQGKVYVMFDTNANEAVVAANPEAKLIFTNFTGINGGNVRFNRAGLFEYEMEGGVACYRVVDDKLVAISGAKYSAADETFSFSTNELGSFVFADRELVDPA